MGIPHHLSEEVFANLLWPADKIERKRVGKCFEMQKRSFILNAVETANFEQF